MVEETVVEDLLVAVEEVVVTCMIIIEEVQAIVEVEVIIMDEEVVGGNKLWIGIIPIIMGEEVVEEEGARLAVNPMVVEVAVVHPIILIHVVLLEEGTTIHQEVVGEDITEVGEGEGPIEEAEDQVVEDHHLLQDISNQIILKEGTVVASNPINITIEEVVTVEDYLMMMEMQVATTTTISTLAATT